MLAIEPPVRIESFDVSNMSNSDIVASMVVFQDGKPRRSAYKKFKIQNILIQDDYASMEQAIIRRFTHYKNNDAGFETAPNLLLIDGGIQHVRVAFDALSKLDLTFPVFGMVKDDRHRTRALVTPEGNEIAIVGQQSVFTLIGTIQEETHRFAITYHQNLRNQRLRYSELDTISKIGPKRKQDLLKAFKSITAISSASLSDLMRILPQDAAQSVYNHFHNKDDQS
jgi:excinuclease ABC subunit C